jgi:hypothetical protein
MHLHAEESSGDDPKALGLHLCVDCSSGREIHENAARDEKL